MTARLLSKARQALTTARRDLDHDDTDAAANRCYYAIFYAAWAMFEARGLPMPKTRSGLIAEFSRHFVRDGTFDRHLGATLGKLENLRAYADYTLEPTPRDKVELAIEEAATFVKAVEDKTGQSSPSAD